MAPPVSGYTAWYDASDSSSLTVASNKVSQWNDKSANALHLTQATAGNQPSYTSTLNGLNIVTEISSAGQTAGTYVRNTALSIASPWTICRVQIVTITQVNGGAGWASGITNENTTFLTAGNQWELYAGTAQVTGQQDNLAAHYYSEVYNGASTAFYMDGIAITVGNPGTTTLTGLTFGANFGLTAFSDCADGEFIIYPSALSTANRQSVESYLNTKWFASGKAYPFPTPRPRRVLYRR